MDNPYSNSGPAAPLQRPNYGAERLQPQVVLNGISADETSEEAPIGAALDTNNGHPPPSLHGMNGSILRPQTVATGLNENYDDLYRAQANGMNLEEALPYPTNLRPNRPSPLLRARSDLGPRRKATDGEHDAQNESYRMRHGWEDEYTSNEYLSLLNSVSVPDPCHD